VTKYIAMIVINLAAAKAGAKLELSGSFGSTNQPQPFPKRSD
jgi:hypothetical protein